MDTDILSISQASGRHLLDSDALPEFKAVIVDQLMELLADDPALRVTPGREKAGDAEIVAGLRAAMHRRTIEATELLARGGILVVRLRPLALLVDRGNPYYMYRTQQPDFYTPADWWIEIVPRLMYLQREQELVLVHAAMGPPGQIEAPGHSLEPYLLEARYSAVLDPVVVPTEESAVLAVNAGFAAIAMQIEVGPGLLLLVPSDGDEALLERCVREMLDLRAAHRTQWRVAAERDALAELAAADLEFRARRAEALARLREIWAKKKEVLEERTVRRARAYFRTASAAGTSRTLSMERLHQMVECIEADFGTQAAFRTSLGLSKKTVDAIRHVANKPEVGARHVDATDPRAITDDEMAAALAAATQILQAFIEYRLAQQSGVAVSA